MLDVIQGRFLADVMVSVMILMTWVSLCVFTKLFRYISVSKILVDQQLLQTICKVA